MAKTPTFYSFHFDKDVFRVQMVRNMGVLDGNEPVSANDWEGLKRSGRATVEKWIDANMAYKRCVVVLIGAETASRSFVQYEIERAWKLKKGLLGVHIHNLKSLTLGTCSKGINPFDQFTVSGERLSNLVPTYDPPTVGAYSTIAANLESWVRQAVTVAAAR